MNKRILLWLATTIASGAIFYRTNTIITAQEKSPTPTLAATIEPTATNRIEKIKALKERVATRVAELKQKDKLVMGGEIKEIDKDIIQLGSRDKTLTLYLSPDTLVASVAGDKRLTQKTTDLRVGDEIAVSALPKIKEDSFDVSTILTADSVSGNRTGKVSEIDTTNGTFTVTSKGDSLLVDVELSTKISRYDFQTKKIARSGLSKIRVGDSAHVYGNLRRKSGSLFANRVLIVPKDSQPSVSPSVQVASPTPKPTRKILPPTATSPAKKPTVRP